MSPNSCAVFNTSTLTGAHAIVLRGVDAITAVQPLLVELADRCSQPGAADYVGYFLTQPYTGGKVPQLVLLAEGPISSIAALDSSSIFGAVLLHEYQFARQPLNIFVTEDYAGERNVLAPAAIRSAVALRVAEYLLRLGAHLIVLSLQDADFDRQLLSARLTSKPAGGWMWSTRQRTLTRRFPLAASYDATLATLGTHTRRNLRYYRRRVEQELQCAFVPHAQITEDQFVQLSQLCSYPTPDFVSRWRFRSANSVPGGILAGIKSASGDWLSIIGGRRHRAIVSIDWQMNQTRFSNLSLSTVMRSYLIEHEIAAGSQTLIFEGGTPHSMRLAFPPDRVVDLIAARNTLPTMLVRRFGTTVLSKKNFLVETISCPDLIWRPW